VVPDWEELAYTPVQSLSQDSLGVKVRKRLKRNEMRERSLGRVGKSDNPVVFGSVRKRLKIGDLRAFQWLWFAESVRNRLKRNEIDGACCEDLQEVCRQGRDGSR
jgi:hypothetical protein